MDRETLALALFAKWSIEGNHPDHEWEAPEWQVYKEGGALNSVGLTKENFLEEADQLLAEIKPHLL